MPMADSPHLLATSWFALPAMGLCREMTDISGENEAADVKMPPICWDGGMLLVA